MATRFIYTVGKHDKNSTVIAQIHASGFLAGILADSSVNSTSNSDYDRVIPVDFSQLESELVRLDALNMHAAGFVCTYENYLLAKAALCGRYQTPGLSTAAAQLTTDKAMMRDAFLAYNKTITPDYARLASLDDALEFAQDHGYPLILKPTNLVKSLLVLRCDNERQLIENYNYAASSIDALYEKYHIYDRSPALILEEFIEGTQYSIAAYVDETGEPHFCDGIARLTTARDIHIDDTYLYKRELPALLPETAQEQLFAVARQGVRALALTSSPAHIELILGPKGAKIVEIGARTGGYRPRMYDACYGLDLAKQEVLLALGKTPELTATRTARCAVYELFSEHDGRLIAINNMPATKLHYYRQTVPVGAPTGPAKHGNKAAAIVIVADSDSARFEQVCAQVEDARVEVAR